MATLVARSPSSAAGQIVKVAMAGASIARNPDSLETLLGSCVGIALWDPTSGWGALAHVVLPYSLGRSDVPGKFADTAVAHLLRELSCRGVSPRGLQAKLAGGATMFGVKTTQDIGGKNCDAAAAELAKHQIRVVATHLGGSQGRVVRFSLTDGTLGIYVGRELQATI